MQAFTITEEAGALVARTPAGTCLASAFIYNRSPKALRAIRADVAALAGAVPGHAAACEQQRATLSRLAA